MIHLGCNKADRSIPPKVTKTTWCGKENSINVASKKEDVTCPLCLIACNEYLMRLKQILNRVEEERNETYKEKTSNDLRDYITEGKNPTEIVSLNEGVLI